MTKETPRADLSHPVLEELLAGNTRYVRGEVREIVNAGHAARTKLVSGQQPRVAVLACSDSRAVPELIFDQAPGQLFVVRVAGNVAESTQLATLEFAVEALGTKFILVLGHTGCGAVTAAVEHLAAGSPLSFAPVVQPILPPARTVSLEQERNHAVEAVVRANVRHVVSHVQHHFADSAPDDLAVHGAVYSLETGSVEPIV